MTVTDERSTDDDRVVDIRDFGRFAECWMATESPASPGWDEKCDLSPDGKIDVADLAILADNWLGGTDI